MSTLARVLVIACLAQTIIAFISFSSRCHFSKLRATSFQLRALDATQEDKVNTQHTCINKFMSLLPFHTSIYLIFILLIDKRSSYLLIHEKAGEAQWLALEAKLQEHIAKQDFMAASRVPVITIYCDADIC